MARLGSLFTAVVLIGLGLDAGVQAAPQARTEAGWIAGVAEPGVNVFRGVPFAAPPVGARRWRSPSPTPAWTGVRPAAAFAPPCMQTRGPGAAGPEPSEDCLYLNVWTPAGAKPGDKLPVLVWIYGGAFRGGSTADPRAAGDEISRRGVVVVTIAYRTGALGYLTHPALSAESPRKVSGNYGLLDQVAALDWTRRNIAAFGGDPAKVTVGGQSAGAISTAMLAVSPAAKGLFRGVISMSGGSFAPPRSPAEGGENMETLAQAEKNGLGFAARLGAADANALRALPAAQILAADSLGSAWPIVDGQAIPGDEYRLYEAGAFADVPLLLGTTADEGYNFSRVKTKDQFLAQTKARYGRFAPKILDAYPAADDAQAVRSDRALLRDVMFGWGTWTWARLQSRHGRAPVHAYYFEHTPPVAPDRPLEAGAYHGADLPYPFGVRHVARDWTPTDLTLSGQMQGYFVNFIKTGDPNGKDLPVWPAFKPKAQTVLRIADTASAGPVANLSNLQLIDAYVAARRDEKTSGAPR